MADADIDSWLVELSCSETHEMNKIHVHRIIALMLRSSVCLDQVPKVGIAIGKRNPRVLCDY